MNKRFFISYFFLLVISIFLFASCEKEDEVSDLSNKVEFTDFIVSEISFKSAQVSSKIPDNYGVEILQFGHCWSQNSNPDINDSISTFSEFTNEVFTSNLQSIKHNSTYHVRAYFKFGDIVHYSEVDTFKTLEILTPTLSTSDMSNLTAKSAIVGGNITNGNGGEILSRGVCWNTTGNPTIEDSITTDTIGLGSFVSNLNNLNINTKYFIRAYATNEVGAGYGNVVMFTTRNGIPDISVYGLTFLEATSFQVNTTVEDDGGLQILEKGVCWNRTGLPNINDSIQTEFISESNYYSFNVSDLDIGTKYYIRAFAVNELGITYSASDNDYFITDNGVLNIVTKEIEGITATSALSGGEILSDEGLEITERGICYNTSGNPTIDDLKTIEIEGMNDFTSNLDGLNITTNYFVRAYAINQVGVSYGNEVGFTTNDGHPLLETVNLSKITYTSLKSGGNIISDEGFAITEKGICWNTIGSPIITDTKINAGTGSEDFTSLIDNLTESETYYFRAYAINTIGIAYGNELNISLVEGFISIQDYDGNWYNTVKIGTQIWLKENLRTTHYANGEALIDGTIEEDINLINDFTTKYWFYNKNFNGTNQEYKNTYGLLYTWAAVMNGFESSNLNPSGIQGVCPDGWHIPSYLEFEELVNYLGGSEIAGGKLKEEGYAHWVEPNNGANNVSGFTALPAGFRYPNGEYYWLGQDAYFWSATEDDGNSIKSFHSATGFNSIPISQTFKSQSISVRCIKD